MSYDSIAELIQRKVDKIDPRRPPNISSSLPHSLGNANFVPDLPPVDMPDPTRNPDTAVRGRTRALDIAAGFEQQVPSEVLDVGTFEDPFMNISQNFRKGYANMRTNSKYFQAAFKSMTGYSEDEIAEAIYQAQESELAAGRIPGAIDAAAEFEQFLDNGDWNSFWNAAVGFMGEVGPSAIASITTALIGTAIVALTAPVSIPTLSVASLGAAGTAAVTRSAATNLAKKGITKKMIGEAIEASAKGKTLTSTQKEVMDAVYKNWRSQVYKKRLKYGALGGAAAQEYPQGTGTFFGAYAEQGMTDPVSALKSFGLGVPFTAIGVGSEALVFKKVTDVFNKSGGRSLITGGPGLGKSNALQRAAGATVVSSQAEGLAEFGQQGLEVLQRFNIDEKYTVQQAKLDLLTSYFAGSVGGLGIGGGASSISAVTSKANELLSNYHEKDALVSMFESKYGKGGQGVQVEPKSWIRAQVEAMMDPNTDKDAVWIDINSYDQYNQIAEELSKKYGNKIVGFELGSPELGIGGILLSTNRDKILSFQNIMEQNVPSTKLLDNTLAGMLNYPRSRQTGDAWVVQVKDKNGNLVHYHQTNDPKEDGNEHLERAKKLFKNNPNYTYEIVDAETHLDQRKQAVGPIISERNIEDDMDPMERDDMTGEFGEDFVPEGFNVEPRYEAPVRTEAPLILNRKKDLWTPPNLEFSEDQLPTQEQIEDARLATHPDHRPEFDEAIKNNEYSRILLKSFIETSDVGFEPGIVYKIEKEGDGYGIGTYQIDPNFRAESFADIKRDLDSIVRRAKNRKNARSSRFQIQTKDGAAVAVDMPFMVNQYRNVLRRAGLLTPGTNEQELVDAFTTLVGTLAEDGDQKLTFEFKELDQAAINNPDAVVFTRGKTKLNLKSLSELTVAQSQQELTDFEKEFQKRTRLDPRNENALRQRLEDLNELEKLTGLDQFQEQQREQIESLLAQGTFDPNETTQETDPLGGQEGDPIFNEKLPEDFWNAELKSYEKQPLNARLKQGRYKAATTGGKPINISQEFVDSFGANRTLIEKLIKTASQQLKITKEIKIFTTRESDVIDVGDPDINARLKERQKKINDSDTIKGQNIEFKDFDVIILKVGIDPDLDIQGVYYKRIGHEIGHSFIRQELANSLPNVPLRTQLLKNFARAKKNNPNILQYQQKNGLEEWAADKIGAILFDAEQGKVFQAKNLSDSFLNEIAKRIKAFERSTRQHMNGQQNRFAFDESFAEYVDGVINAMKEPSARGDMDMNYESRAQVEDLIDAAFGSNFSEKTLRKINREAEKIIKNKNMPKWFKKIFYDAHSFLSTLGKDQGIGEELADIFHTVSGKIGQTGFINEANRQTNELVVKLAKVLKMEDGSRFGEKELAVLKEASNEKISDRELSEDARAVRKFLSDIYNELNLKDLGIKKRANFFPRIIAVAEIAANPKKRAKLIELLVDRNKGKTFTRVVRDENGKKIGTETFTATEEEITKEVERIIRNNEINPELATDSKFDVGMLLSRAELFEALDTETLQDEGLVVPPEVSILEYIQTATRRSQYAKRGGSARVEQLIEALPEEDRKHAKEAVNAFLGKINPIENDLWRHINSYGQLMNVVTLLGMAVFASVPDAAGPVLRSRNVELKTIVNNLARAFGARENAELAKSMGANGLDAAATTILYAGELSSQTPFSKIASNTWFRWTQLERWTQFTRKFAAGMGRDFLLKHAKIVKEGKPGDEQTLISERYLAELGLTAEDVIAWDGRDLDLHPKIKTALGRFVDESIVRPNAAERPIWASDPNFALVWQLKSFYYAYGKNIVGGLYREGKTRYGETDKLSAAIYPLLFGAALLAPLTMLGWDLRERFKMGLAWLLPGISPNDPGVDYRASRDMPMGEWSFEILDRSGYLGPFALTMPLFMESKRYGNPFFIPMLGPTAEKGWDLITGDFEITDYTPLYSQLDTRALGR